jgi:hypothetical protein
MSSDNKESEQERIERLKQEQRKRFFGEKESPLESMRRRIEASKRQAHEKADKQPPEGDNPNSIAALADRREPDDQGRDRQGLSANLRMFGEFLGDWLKRRYSSVRVIAR